MLLSESWLERVWGKMLVSIKLMDPSTVLIQLSSSKEIDEILKVAQESLSPFVMLERWMEVISVPLRPQWVKILGFLCKLGERGCFGC